MNEALVQPAALWRRVGSIFYDSLLLSSVLILATALVLPFNDGVAISPDRDVFSIYLLVVSFAYFGWFWTHGGQTLGMRVWRVRALARQGETLTWKQAAVRFAAAIISWLPLGLGFLWMLWSPTSCTWHDRWSRTMLVLVPK